MITDSWQIAKPRLEYMDTTKGLLMLCLIWGHLIIFAKSLGLSDNEFTQPIQNTVPFYRAFFMQTFFFITGYCSSWNVPFVRFLRKNILTIIVPAFIFLPFNFLAKSIMIQEFSLSALASVYLSYCINGIPWFLAALFIAKLIYYFIERNFKALTSIWGTITLLFVIGLYVSHSLNIDNIWSFQHALLMIPFLGLGRFVKRIMGGGVISCHTGY